MFNLIKKDYIFTRKQLYVVMIYCLAAPILLLIDGGSKLYWAQFFIPFCCVSFILSKIFYMEDATDVRYFLKRLPYTVHERVAARFCFMGITLCLSEVYLGLVQYFLFHQSMEIIIKSNAIPALIFVMYYSLYIMLAYCKGYLFAQNSIYVCMVVAAFMTIAYEKMNIPIDFSKMANFKSVICLIILSIGIIFLFYLIACRGDVKREN